MRCPTHLCIGHEAASAVVGYVLNKFIMLCNYRSHGHYLGKGGDLNKRITKFMGRKQVAQKVMVVLCIWLIQLASAWYSNRWKQYSCWNRSCIGFKTRKSDIVTAVFLGEGAIEEGVF